MRRGLAVRQTRAQRPGGAPRRLERQNAPSNRDVHNPSGRVPIGSGLVGGTSRSAGFVGSRVTGNQGERKDDGTATPLMSPDKAALRTLGARVANPHAIQRVAHQPPEGERTTGFEPATPTLAKTR